MEQNAAKIFSENWNIYQKVIQHNYMHHAELINKTAALIGTLTQKNLTILDIGCGDALVLLPLLKTIITESYTGYDLSDFALQLAASNLKEQHFPVILKEGDMAVLIKKEQKRFDVIHSSFAIHHLKDDEKIELFIQCFERLNPGGTLIYTDIFRQQQASRSEYLEGYFSYIKNHWSLLEPYEKQPIYDHVGQYDFPSRIEETAEWLKSAGFNVCEIYQPDSFHAMLALNKK